MKKTAKRNLIPIFFAVDDNYAPYLSVTLRSLIENSSNENVYDINILIEELSDRNVKNILTMQTENVKIKFVSVYLELLKLEKKLFQT
jgi:lipopolysaccharide biosynthesis glycosyltransferase